MFECVINISEGRDATALAAFARSAGASLRDVHSDYFHHRSVFTLINDRGSLIHDVRSFITAVMGTLDVRHHDGVHPRTGVVDVVPFVSLDHDLAGAVTLRNDTADWMIQNFPVGVFLYGPAPRNSTDSSVVTLPGVRARARRHETPDLAASVIDPRVGISMVGAREPLVAWNIWLSGVSLAAARELARTLRSTSTRTLAFPVGDFVQVSCNFVDPLNARCDLILDELIRELPHGGKLDHCELVGLAPRAVLRTIDSSRWEQLGLSDQGTIEYRLEQHNGPADTPRGH
jgi:glutamate formiminotransferase